MLAAQILSVIIFVAMFVMIVSDKIERHYVTLGCGILTIVAVFGIALRSMDAVMETLNIRNIVTLGFWYDTGSASEASSGINWATIIFIAGMMVMVEGMAKAGFFRWLCMALAKLVNYKPVPLLCVVIRPILSSVHLLDTLLVIS